MPCPHGHGPREKCSQCVGAPHVKRVELVRGRVLVDGVSLETTKEHTASAEGALARRPVRARGPGRPRRCRLCGRTGHTALRCPGQAPDEPADIDGG